MSAQIRPLLGLAAGFFIWGCSKPPASPHLMKMPAILSDEMDAKVLSARERNFISTEDTISFSMARGAAPQREDALTFQTRCWSSKEPYRIMERLWESPFKAEVPVYELIPEEALRPSKNMGELNCLWDIYLRDDEGNTNYQKDLPLTLKLEAGGLSLLFRQSPTNVLHEYIYEHYQLTTTSEDQTALEIICEDLGSSKERVTTSNLQALVSGYLKATAQIPSSSDFLKCRILSRSEESRKFTKVFTLIRNYKPLTLKLEAALLNSEHLEFKATVTNPNPFPGYAFFSSAPLWKDITIDYNWSGRYDTAHLGGGEAAWQPLSGSPLESLQVGGRVIHGFTLRIEAGGDAEMISRANLRGALCWSPHAPHTGNIVLQLEASLPIYTWKDGSPISPLKDPNHSETLWVTHQKDNPLLTRSCQ